MEEQQKYNGYQISGRMKKILRLSDAVLGDYDVTELNEAQIHELNKRAIPNNRKTRALFGSKKKSVEYNTFIIPVEDGALTGYFFEPKASHSHRISSLRPLIIFYHGGGWVLGNMDIYISLCNRIAAITNSAVLAVDYRLAPAYTFPTAAEDCYASLLWAALGARYWKVDPERIYVMGDSAGGNLAAVVCRMARDRKGPHLAGQILIYPVTDGRMRTPSYEQHKDSPTLTMKMMQFFIKSYQKEPKDILNPSFSPLLSKDHSRLPPALIFAAEYDPLLDDAILYSEALRSADTPVNCLKIDRGLHGYYLYPNATGTEETDAAIIQFILGRPVQNITLKKRKELIRQNRAESRNLKKKNRDFIAAGVEESS